jgi:hypothetical protein
MPRAILAAAAFVVLSSASAFAQENGVGAGRIEIESALLGGGALFMPSSGPHSTGYVFDVAGTANVNNRLGLEGDFAWAMTRRQEPAFSGVSVPNERTPNMLFYTGNLVISPGGHDHHVVPYLEFGGGGLTVLDTSTTGGFGLAGNSTHWIASAGGGFRWFPLPHWGVRVDYRFIGIRNAGFAAPAGVTAVGHAHRVLGALVITF